MRIDRFRTAEACRAIAAEFRMFAFLKDRLMGGRVEPGHDEGLLDQALLDSFLVHIRVLRDFFFHEGHRSEDLVAAQFVPNWKLIRPEGAHSLQRNKQALEQALGRLTTRLKRPRENWDLAALESEIAELIVVFRVHLPEELQRRFDRPDIDRVNIRSDVEGDVP